MTRWIFKAFYLRDKGSPWSLHYILNTKCQDLEGADSLCSLKLPAVIRKLKFLKSDASNTARPPASV